LPNVPETGNHENNSNGDDIDGEGTDVPEEVWEPYMDFRALSEGFSGIVGWIKLEGTAIDYPIMQWTNNSYFLSRLPDGTSHRSGSVFLDYRNNADFSDKGNSIYAHESKTQDMFGSLKNYRRQEFYEEHPTVYIYTPVKDYELVLIAGYLVDSGVEIPPLGFKDEDAFFSHIDNIKSRSFFKSDVSVGPDDRLVNLCTCAYDYTNARWIIVGKLVEFGGE